MNDSARGGAGLRSASLLSAGELMVRRVAWQRRRRRRRVLALAVVVALAAAALALARGPSHGPARAARPAVDTRPRHHRQPSAGARRPIRVRRAINRRAGGERRSVERLLARTSYVQLAGHRRREVALTFDDGPSPYTHLILQTLRRTHTAATFFVVGTWAKTYPRVVATEARDGFEVGDHTETHAYLTELSPAGQAAQIENAGSAIRRAGAPAPFLFRPPYGAFNATTLSILHRRRLLMVLWSVDTSDYARPGVARIIYTALSGARPGAIILMHDGGGDRSQTAAALPRIIAGLRKRGYRLVTISRLVADDPPSPHQPRPQSLSGIG
jgi:peptidoglycan/xylan/chitin deacetylase (PgdA/CDA1 family)